MYSTILPRSAASDRLFARLSPCLTRMAAYYARHCPEEADDLRQEAWLGVLEALPALDQRRGEAEAFLLQYARWRMRDAVRRSLRHAQPAPLDDTLHDDAAGWRLGERLTEHDLDAFLTHLSATQRTIVACLLAGFTWRETGQALACTSANVAYHVRRIGEHYRAWQENAL